MELSIAVAVFLLCNVMFITCNGAVADTGGRTVELATDIEDEPVIGLDLPSDLNGANVNSVADNKLNAADADENELVPPADAMQKPADGPTPPAAANVTNIVDDFSRIKRASVIQGPQKLIDVAACPEIRNLCGDLRGGSDDLSVLECVQTFLTNQVESLADECQHAVWRHTTNLIDDANILQLTGKVCGDVLLAFEFKATKDVGSVLARLIDHKDEIKHLGCSTLITRLEAVAFSDFRLVSPFVRDCSADIEANACGRFRLERNALSQGETLACLQGHIDTLAQECKKGIIHLSELQSDNVKLDRPLFLACVEDVARFCAESRPGQIYKCLLLHKNEEQMSRTCAEQLMRRYKIIAHDYKVIEPKKREDEKENEEETNEKTDKENEDENEPHTVKTTPKFSLITINPFIILNVRLH